MSQITFRSVLHVFPVAILSAVLFSSEVALAACKPDSPRDTKWSKFFWNSFPVEMSLYLPHAEIGVSEKFEVVFHRAMSAPRDCERRFTVAYQMPQAEVTFARELAKSLVIDLQLLMKNQDSSGRFLIALNDQQKHAVWSIEKKLSVTGKELTATIAAEKGLPDAIVRAVIYRILKNDLGPGVTLKVDGQKVDSILQSETFEQVRVTPPNVPYVLRSSIDRWEKEAPAESGRAIRPRFRDLLIESVAQTILGFGSGDARLMNELFGNSEMYDTSRNLKF